MERDLYKDCHDLYAKVYLWLVWAWVRISFTTIFADKLPVG